MELPAIEAQTTSMDFGKSECKVGGSGSGRWWGHRPRRTVETCESITIQDLKLAGQLRPIAPEWRWEGILPAPRGWDGYAVWPDLPWPKVRLPDGAWVDVEQWSPPLGGVSWWLHCPKCDRRCRSLHRLPGAHWFYCRRCLGLAYTSSQEAHKWDRGSWARVLSLLTGVTPNELEKEMRADFKAQRQAIRRWT